MSPVSKTKGKRNWMWALCVVARVISHKGMGNNSNTALHVFWIEQLIKLMMIVKAKFLTVGVGGHRQRNERDKNDPCSNGLEFEKSV